MTKSGKLKILHDVVNVTTKKKTDYVDLAKVPGYKSHVIKQRGVVIIMSDNWMFPIIHFN